MSVASEWYAVEVSGAVTDLTSNLNALDNQGYQIFSVVIAPKGWTVVARKPKGEQKPLAEEKAKEETPRRGTVTLHKGHKK